MKGSQGGLRSRIRLYPEGKLKFRALQYDGVKWNRISEMEWRQQAMEEMGRSSEEGKRIRPSDIDDYFGDLVIEDINLETQGKLLLSDGRILDLDDFQKREKTSEAEDFLHDAKEFKDSFITMQFGASWIPRGQRLEEDRVADFLRERINDEETWQLFCFVLCHALTGRVSIKAILMLLNIRFNTGKSVAMYILFRLFGTYAVKISPILFQKENIDRLTKFLFVHKDCLLLIIDETDKGFRPDIPTLKKITGRDLFANSYVSTYQDQFQVRGMLFADSNEVLQHRGEASSGIESRLFLVPFGQPVPREARTRGLENILTQPDLLNTFFSNLIDDWYGFAMTTPLPPKSGPMQHLDLVFRLRQDPTQLFLEMCTISTESNATMGAQRLNTLEIHQHFIRFSKRLFVDLVRKVRFDRREDGTEMDFHELNLELPLPNHREFKARVDRIMGEANELERTERGYRWTRFVVKQLVIMYLTRPELEAIYGPMHQMINLLDKIKSDFDTIKSVEGHLNTMAGLTQILASGFEDSNTPSPEMLALALSASRL